jgi:DNA-binding response OmpR family regulator
MYKILIVEDDESLRLLTDLKLKKEFDTYLASDGIEALNILENVKVDLILSDIMMPNMDGFELVKEVRSFDEEVPIIMLTAKGEIDDKVTSFDNGVDDYMVKPIDFVELKCRIRAILKRNNIKNINKITIDDIIIDNDTLSIKNGKEEIILPKKEFEILYKLFSNTNRIFTYNDLLDSIWGLDSESDETTVRTHINRLRKKIEHFDEIDIETIRGLGYKGVIK